MAEVDPPRHHHHPPPQDKRIKYTRTLYLPREIIFDILLLVPAKVLHKVVRYVCKQWNDIVNDPCFIKAHFQSSSSGYLIQNPMEMHPVYYTEGDNSTEIAFPFPTKIYGSFNGLVLFQDLRNPQILILSVINPVTKVKISLPPVPLHGVRFETVLSNICFAITTCGHYKVVVTVHAEDHCPNLHVMVFTIGIDKVWRFIDLQGFSHMVEWIPRIRPRFVAGILYWCCFTKPCFSMDVDTETIYHLPMQDNFFRPYPQSHLISLGVGLGVMQEHKGNSNYNYRVWKLTDRKSGKWIELAKIDITAILRTIKNELFPRKCCSHVPAMLIDDFFWFYYSVDGKFAVFRFNLTNQSFVFFSIKHATPFSELYHHVHTLLSPKKCYP